MILMYQREHIRLFRSGERYKISKKDGDLTIVDQGSGGFPSSPHYIIQRNNEEIPTDVGTFDFAENFLKNAGKVYFKDCPKMLDALQERKLKDKMIKDVLDYYEELDATPFLR